MNAGWALRRPVSATHTSSLYEGFLLVLLQQNLSFPKGIGWSSITFLRHVPVLLGWMLSKGFPAPAPQNCFKIAFSVWWPFTTDYPPCCPTYATFVWGPAWESGLGLVPRLLKMHWSKWPCRCIFSLIPQVPLKWMSLIMWWLRCVCDQWSWPFSVIWEEV